MSRNITVRMATPDDWVAIAGLLVELGRGVAAGTADDPTHRQSFAGHLRQLGNVTLVAEMGGEVVGVIDMEYHQRLGDHRPQARVNDVVVTEHARGRRGRHRPAATGRGAGAQARLLPHGPRHGNLARGIDHLLPARRVARLRGVVRETARRRRHTRAANPRTTTSPLQTSLTGAVQRGNRCSAISTASSAAPLRRLSAQLNSAKASSRPGTCRIRPTERIVAAGRVEG